MKFLLDTNVVSAGSPTKALENNRLRRWVEDRSRQSFISAVTLAEVADGVARLDREQPGRRASALRDWLVDLTEAYADRVLPIGTEIALAAGRLLDLARGQGHSPGLADALIAATARQHGLTVATRNVRHFRPFQVDLFDPLAGASGP